MTDQEIIDRIRLILGGVSPEDLPDAVIQMFLEKWKYSLNVTEYPDRWPLVIYNTTLDCVRWLILQEVQSGESSITERTEKIGDETISIKGGSTFKSWKDMLDWLLANPEYIDPSLAFNAGLIIIGGVRQDEFARVKQGPNSYNGFMEQGVFATPAIPTRSECGSVGRRRRSPWMVR
ncbi:hypothetical protein KASHIRA_00620 [Serratia phage vB_SmaM-Kashira]|nr:hypothetical protein KASHIRA_00620 [Serratia phage vB_SmaM-Kashira]